MRLVKWQTPASIVTVVVVVVVSVSKSTSQLIRLRYERLCRRRRLSFAAAWPCFLVQSVASRVSSALTHPNKLAMAGSEGGSVALPACQSQSMSREARLLGPSGGL